MTKKCPNCGKSIDNNANFCVNCGTKQSKEGEIKEETITTVETTNNKPKVPVNGFSITGFVFAMVSLLCCGLTAPLGLIFSIVGIAKADKADSTGKGLAIAGIIVSAILLILFILMILTIDALGDIYNNVTNEGQFNNYIISGYLFR